jgi:hypothetical protein
MAKARATAKWQKAGALALAVLPLAATSAVVLWYLHHPNPKVLAPVVIDRMSLLPHQYAGPCINCHRIQEGTPVALSSANMSSFRLTPVDRQLLTAGQEVQVPDLSRKLRIPAITRTDGLPHPYVGVCSNCHVVLDVHPSPAFMKEAMRRAGRPLAGLNLPAAATARGGAFLDIRRAGYRRALGYAALPLMLATIVFVAMQAFVRAGAKSDAPGGAQSRWLRIHEWFGGAFCVATALHWYFSDRGNNFLHLALVSLSCLAAGGLLLRLRGSKPADEGGGLLLFAQRVALVALVVFVLVGHFFSAFD